ncbi:hypothetical protein [Pseudomonas japonica]|uniref:hypothetical protein n=1 Tax=Pseudomonas japonica TaxID=256466 RepID=UPI0015E429C9|nr:hypothetical protein [Pseudomonas japonica]MBA1245046.1 hypothetical protein [Pseudomonas japonica]
MNLLDVVHHKEFLDRIFPDGISEKIVVAQVSVDSFGSTELGIHVRKKPAINIPKWGEWGEDYNTIVIKAIGVTVKSLTVINIQKAAYADFSIAECADGYLLSQSNGSWSIELVFESLMFHRCVVYLDGAEDF